MNERGSVSLFAASLMTVLALAVTCVGVATRIVVAHSQLQTTLDNIAVRAAQRALWGEAAYATVIYVCWDSGQSIEVRGSEELTIFGIQTHIYAESLHGYGPRERGLSPP